MPKSMRSMLVALAMMTATCAGAQSIKINVDEHDVAIGGYDTVAYFTLGKPTKGDGRYEIRWEDAHWRFASAQHRDMFVRDPDRYAPRFGGFCALGMSRGYLSIVDPEAWRVVDGRLFLAVDKKGMESVREAPPDALDKAEKNWQTLGRR